MAPKKRSDFVLFAKQFRMTRTRVRDSALCLKIHDECAGRLSVIMKPGPRPARTMPGVALDDSEDVASRLR
jgi:hypothetical protein